MTWLLVVVQVGLYALFWRLPVPAISQFEAALGLQPAEVMATLQRLGECQPSGAGVMAAGRDVGRLLAMVVGYGLLQPGAVPVLVDSFFLAALGRRLEARLGSMLFLAVYLSGAAAAAAVHVALDPSSTVLAVGASGSVSALVGAYAVACAGARVRMMVPVVVIPAFLHLPVFAVVLAWFALQIPVVKQLLAIGHGAPLGWWAHGGAFALGLVAGPLARRRGRKRRRSTQAGGAARVASAVSSVRIDRKPTT